MISSAQLFKILSIFNKTRLKCVFSIFKTKQKKNKTEKCKMLPLSRHVILLTWAFYSE